MVVGLDEHRLTMLSLLSTNHYAFMLITTVHSHKYQPVLTTIGKTVNPYSALTTPTNTTVLNMFCLPVLDPD